MIRYYSNILYDGSPEINAHIATHIATYAHEESVGVLKIKIKRMYFISSKAGSGGVMNLIIGIIGPTTIGF